MNYRDPPEWTQWTVANLPPISAHERKVICAIGWYGQFCGRWMERPAQNLHSLKRSINENFPEIDVEAILSILIGKGYVNIYNDFCWMCNLDKGIRYQVTRKAQFILGVDPSIRWPVFENEILDAHFRREFPMDWERIEKNHAEYERLKNGTDG